MRRCFPMLPMEAYADISCCIELNQSPTLCVGYMVTLLPTRLLGTIQILRNIDVVRCCFILF